MSAFIRTNVCPQLHVSVVSGLVPVRVMIHWSADKTFLAGVAFGILASATSAVIFFFLIYCKSPHVQPS